MIRAIIEYLQTVDSYPSWYPYAIFVGFCSFRYLAIVARNYYDFHVYNYFKFVENAIRAWLYTDLCQFRQWQIPDNKKAAIINIMTKDIKAFEAGSW